MNAAAAEALVAILQRTVGASQQVRLLDHREGFIKSWDHASVAAAVEVLTVGLQDPEISDEVRVIAEGLLDLLQFWITEEYEPAYYSEDS